MYRLLLLSAFLTIYLTGTAQKITIDTSIRFQQIHSFGASDCWSVQWAGKWPDAKRKQMAQWLFSTENNANGQPKGIGLSLWRYSIGTGTADPGRHANISNLNRRSETLIDSTGKSIPDAQPGQRWFLKEAKKYGVEYNLAFALSAPVWLTKNGTGNTTGLPAHDANISPEQYRAYAMYIAQTLQVLEKDGIRIQYLSPFNEPQWDWKSAQEGCSYNNEELANFTRILNETMLQQRISSQLIIGEAAYTDALYKQNETKNGDQLNAFFDRASPYFVGNLSTLPAIFSYHSYFRTWPTSKLIAERTAIAKRAQERGITLWQTEFFPFGENHKEALMPSGDSVELKDHPFDSTINYALSLARTIHYDLTVANVSSWQYWLAITTSNWNDGLIKMDHHASDGSFHDSKHLWAFGNFSRFIRPGAYRVGSSSGPTDDPTKLMRSSYYHPINGTVTTVFINYSTEPVSVQLEPVFKKSSTILYVTDNTTDTNLKPAKTTAGRLTLPARSICTAVETSRG